jgi:hypothetical protein
MCKVQWVHHTEDGAIWEHEELRADYLELFPTASES